MITKAIIPNLNEKHCPPLFVLTYAIREIIGPTLATSHIADLLKLLAQVEHIRRLIIEQVELALAEQKALSASGKTEGLLEPSVVNKLNRIVKRSKSQRVHYSTVTLSLRSLVSAPSLGDTYLRSFIERTAHIFPLVLRRVIHHRTLVQRVFPHAACGPGHRTSFGRVLAVFAPSGLQRVGAARCLYVRYAVQEFHW